MTPWIQIYSNLPEHPKIYQLADTLEASNYEAVGVVVSLWLWAAKNAPDGDLSRFPVRALGDAVGWREDTKRLYQALVSCGFIDQDGENTRLHDWEEYAVRLMEIIDRKKKKEQCRAKEYRRRKKLETPVEGEQAEQAESELEEDTSEDSETRTEEQSPCTEHLESSPSRDASRYRTAASRPYRTGQYTTGQNRTVHYPTTCRFGGGGKTDRGISVTAGGTVANGGEGAEELCKKHGARGLSPGAGYWLRQRTPQVGLCPGDFEPLAAERREGAGRPSR